MSKKVRISEAANKFSRITNINPPVDIRLSTLLGIFIVDIIALDYLLAESDDVLRLVEIMAMLK